MGSDWMCGCEWIIGWGPIRRKLSKPRERVRKLTQAFQSAVKSCLSFPIYSGCVAPFPPQQWWAGSRGFRHRKHQKTFCSVEEVWNSLQLRWPSTCLYLTIVPAYLDKDPPTLGLLIFSICWLSHTDVGSLDCACGSSALAFVPDSMLTLW